MAQDGVFIEGNISFHGTMLSSRGRHYKVYCRTLLYFIGGVEDHNTTLLIQTQGQRSRSRGQRSLYLLLTEVPQG